jgi:uncharacterized protein
MERDVMWQPWAGPGLEHLHLTRYDGGVLADGLLVGVHEGSPFRARYVVQCDEAWRVREVRIDLLDAANRRLDLIADGEGHWTDSSGGALPGLAGCFDVDISATPFTNTLPIRRLALAPGASADINVAYVALPELSVQPRLQRYACLALNAGSGRYRFESPFHHFVAELPVDQDGLVVDYPGLFRRIPPAESSAARTD